MHRAKTEKSEQLHKVKMRARVGSPVADSVEKPLSIGTRLSFEMAYKRRGAEMRLCRPAPVVAMKLPMRMAHSFGHARLATTKRPPMLCPNLGNVKQYILSDLIN